MGRSAWIQHVDAEKTPCWAQYHPSRPFRALPAQELCKDMQIPVSTLEATHQQHFEAAKKQEKDPEGGPYPAYPSGAGFGGFVVLFGGSSGRMCVGMQTF